MHIIFDLYGTLYQPGLSVMSALRQISDRLGLPYPDEAEVYQLLHQDMDTYLKTLFPQLADYKELKTLFLEYEKQHSQGGDLFPRTKEVLSRLKEQGHRLSVCSTGNDAFMQSVLHQNGIAECFQTIVSARPFRSKGAAIASFLRTGETAVLVGDTLIDFMAASENHLPSIGVSHGFGAQDDFSAATFRAANLEDVLDFVQQVQVMDELTKTWLRTPKARILGVNGVDTSGKTTFARNYQRYLRAIGLEAEMVSMDDFHQPKAIRSAGNEKESYYLHGFDTHKLIREILQPLLEQGRCETEILCLNLKTDLFDKRVKVNLGPHTLLIVEGVYLFRPPLNSYIDTKVYLDITFEEVLRRAEERDVPLYGQNFLERYKSKYIPLQKRYIAEHDPKENADLVISNMNPKRPYVVKSLPNSTLEKK